MESNRRVEANSNDLNDRGKETIPFVVKVKPRSVMGDYIALHGLVPQNELPLNLRHKIPEDEIWIREDIYSDPDRRERILQGHEKFELGLMETKMLTYKDAHCKAEIHEKFYKIEEELEKVEKDLKIETSEQVKVVEPTTEIGREESTETTKANENKES
jgi:hypothetical protein